jgi:plasmid maintenance system antidote protein VapI
VLDGRSIIEGGRPAVRFDKAFGGGADLSLRMQAAHDLAKVQQSEEVIRVRRLAWPA